MGVYYGRLPQEFNVGGYHRSLPWEATAGVYCGMLPQEVTMGVYYGRFNDLIGCGGDTQPIKCHNNDVIVVMGSINQSKSFLAQGVYCRRLLWEFIAGGYCGSLLREVTVGVYCGTLNVHHCLSLVTIGCP